MTKMYNNGEWTEARFNGFIKSLLRAGSQKWGPRNQCIKEARTRRGWYRCDCCKQEVPATLPPKPGNKKRIKNIVADHVEPVVSTMDGFTTWDEVIERMFVERAGFQALCHSCHTNVKSAQEREERKKYGTLRQKFEPEYNSWKAMKNRCLNPKNDAYENYGGRGIGVCERWLDFESFLEDMSPRPAGHSIERLDVDGDYTPENCSWADPVEQARNRRNNSILTACGVSLCISEWCVKLGVSSSTVANRLGRGWTDEEALGFAERTPAKRVSKVPEDTWRLCERLRTSGMNWRQVAEQVNLNPDYIRKTIAKRNKHAEKL